MTSTTGKTTPTPTVITVVHCWSAPRSRSTALLYSFEARGSNECVAIDEPLYREWLIKRGDSVARPYTREMIEGVPPPDAPPEEASVWERELLSLTERIQRGASQLVAGASSAGGDESGGGGGGGGGGVIFCKHMAKHCFLYDFEKECTAEDPTTTKLIHKHLLLIRDPVQVLSSWSNSSNVHGNNPTPDEVGIVPMLSIYSTLQSRSSSSSSTGSGNDGEGEDDDQPNNESGGGDDDGAGSVVLLDSDELASDPEGTLSNTCKDLCIPYKESMITWESGPHACDGPWAKWWYQNVHKSNGWHKSTIDYKQYYPQTVTFRTLQPELLPALNASFPAYRFLKSLTRRYRLRGPPNHIKYSDDQRNANLLVYVGARGIQQGCIVPRDMASINPWDSVVQGGDACWEGIRVYRNKILQLDQHLNRLLQSAKALGFDPLNMHTKEEIIHAIFQILAANGMRDGVHIRLTLTRGEKCTSSMNPKFNVYGTTLIILPEWKPTEGATTYDNTKGIKLISASQRRNPPATLDSKIHHNNLINNILPKIQANNAGVDDAIMLDMDGYVSETNATNIFMVDNNGVLMTPSADHCLPGITRQAILELAKEAGIPTQVRRISLAEFHSADEVFTTGTMGGLTPVTCIDGRMIGPTGERGEITKRLQEIYRTLPERPGWATDIPQFK